MGEGEGNRDAWMACYSADYAAAVWIGYDTSQDGALPQDATGGKYPALILEQLVPRPLPRPRAKRIFHALWRQCL